MWGGRGRTSVAHLPVEREEELFWGGGGVPVPLIHLPSEREGKTAVSLPILLPGGEGKRKDLGVNEGRKNGRGGFTRPFARWNES